MTLDFFGIGSNERCIANLEGCCIVVCISVQATTKKKTQLLPPVLTVPFFNKLPAAPRPFIPQQQVCYFFSCRCPCSKRAVPPSRRQTAGGKRGTEFCEQRRPRAAAFLSAAALAAAPPFRGAVRRGMFRGEYRGARPRLLRRDTDRKARRDGDGDGGGGGRWGQPGRGSRGCWAV